MEPSFRDAVSETVGNLIGDARRELALLETGRISTRCGAESTTLESIRLVNRRIADLESVLRSMREAGRA